MWGALLAATLAGWLHQLTGTELPDGTLAGYGLRGGQAMLATLRWRLVGVPARLVRHAGTLTLRLPPASTYSPRFSPGSAACPPSPDNPACRPPRGTLEPANPARVTRAVGMTGHRKQHPEDHKR